MYIYGNKYIAHLFLELEIFQKEILKKIENKCIFSSTIFFLL
jgi:hypothetical protein